MLRTKPVDDGKVWTSVSAAVEQVQIRSERHNEHIAALRAGSQRQEITPEFLAHLAFNHCGDNGMKLMRKHPDLYDLNLGPANRVVGHSKHCTGCLVANRRLGVRAAYNHCLTKVATSPGECYFADVVGPINPLGIGGAKYILVDVDAFTTFLHVMPMRRKSQAASLLAQLFERVWVQVIRKRNNGVRKLHTDKGGEFMSRDLESFCAWRGIVHTVSDTAAHQSNGVAERRIGQLTTGIRSCLLRSCLPHTLWVEAAMHVAHAQNWLPTQTLLNHESGTTSKDRKYTDLEELTRLAPDIRRCIPYLLYYGDVTDDEFRLLVQHISPFGVQVIVYPCRASPQHLKERGLMGYFMGPGDGPSIDRVYITRDTGSTGRQYRHVVTPLVCLEMHAALMRVSGMANVMLSKQQELEQFEGDQASFPHFERGEFTVADRNLNEVPPYQNDAFMCRVRERAMFDTVRAAQPADKAATSIRAQGRDWAAGEHPGVSKLHNQPGRTLIATDRPREGWPAGTVRSPPPEPAMLFSRDAHRHNPEVAADVVAQTCERLLTMREPGLRPTWGLDAISPPAADVNEVTEEHIREVHHDRLTVDCGNSGMSPDMDILESLAGDASPSGTEGSDSDLPMDSPSEPAPPPHPAAMGNASPVRGLRGVVNQERCPWADR